MNIISIWYKIIGRDINIVVHLIIIQSEKLFLKIGILDSVFVP